MVNCRAGLNGHQAQCSRQLICTGTPTDACLACEPGLQQSLICINPGQSSGLHSAAQKFCIASLLQISRKQCNDLNRKCNPLRGETLLTSEDVMQGVHTLEKVVRREYKRLIAKYGRDAAFPATLPLQWAGSWVGISIPWTAAAVGHHETHLLSLSNGTEMQGNPWNPTQGNDSQSAVHSTSKSGYGSLFEHEPARPELCMCMQSARFEWQNMQQTGKCRAPLLYAF